MNFCETETWETDKTISELEEELEEKSEKYLPHGLQAEVLLWFVLDILMMVILLDRFGKDLLVLIIILGLGILIFGAMAPVYRINRRVKMQKYEDKHKTIHMLMRKIGYLRKLRNAIRLSWDVKNYGQEPNYIVVEDSITPLAILYGKQDGRVLRISKRYTSEELDVEDVQMIIDRGFSYLDDRWKESVKEITGKIEEFT